MAGIVTISSVLSKAEKLHHCGRLRRPLAVHKSDKAKDKGVLSNELLRVYGLPAIFKRGTAVIP